MAKRKKLQGDDAGPVKKSKLRKQDKRQPEQDLETQVVPEREEKQEEIENTHVEKQTQNKNDKVQLLKVKKSQDEQSKGATEFKNKERVLLMSSRGVTFRFRHMMLDFMQLLPHSKKEVKLDNKKDKTEVTELADIRGCTSAVVFEGRKRQDAYLWLSKLPMGPTAKFLVNNIHTMSELKLSGNHLKGSRPILSFHPDFDQQPHLQLLKEMLIQVFATPKKHYKSKPFTDHTMVFSHMDDRIWIRNYQIITQPKADTKTPKLDELELVEVGPRACMQLIKIFGGAFAGEVLYENPKYVTPNAIRAAIRKKGKEDRYVNKVKSREDRGKRKKDRVMPIDEINKVFKG